VHALRVGTEKAVGLLAAPKWDAELLGELTRVMTDSSICGLGQAAIESGEEVLKHFAKDVS